MNLISLKLLDECTDKEIMKKINNLLLTLLLISTQNIFADDIVSFTGADHYVEGQKISVTFYPGMFSEKKYPKGYIDASLGVEGKLVSKVSPFQKGAAPQTLTYVVQKTDVRRGYILINIFYMAGPKGKTIDSFSKTLTIKQTQADYDHNLKELVDGAKKRGFHYTK